VLEGGDAKGHRGLGFQALPGHGPALGRRRKTHENRDLTRGYRMGLVVNIVTQMEGGGAQRAAVMVTQKLRELGFDSEVWFLYKKRPTYNQLPFVRCVLDRPPKGPRDVIRIIRTLHKWLKELSPEGVITYTHYANVIGQAIAYFAGVQHRLATQRNPSDTYPWLARWLDLIWGNIGVYTANVFVSSSVQKSFKAYPDAYLKRSFVVLNGIEPLHSHLAKEEAREKFSLPLDSFGIVNVGRLAEQKNQALLIEVLSILKATGYDDVFLAIAGDGELREQLELLARRRQVRDRVYFLGELMPNDVPDFLRTGDVFVFPSRFEAFGFALVEAMMMGLPVIASDIDAHREVVGDAGILLPLNEAEVWVEAIKGLIANEEKRMRLADASRSRAGNFSAENMVKGYLSLLFGSGQ